MCALRKELLRGIITNGNLKTAGDLQSYLKDLFKDTFLILASLGIKNTTSSLFMIKSSIFVFIIIYVPL